MAAREHGRWTIERLGDGWRYGKSRDNEKKLHPNIVHWKDLDEATRDWDRNAILAWPKNLAKQGWIIVKTNED